MFCSYFFLPSNSSRSSTPSYPSNCKSFFKNAKTQHNNKAPKQRKPNQTKNSKCKQIKAQKKTVEFIICWSTAPEHEVCSAVVDKPRVLQQV